MLKYFANQPPYKRCKASNGPSFAFVGSNLAFQAALIEASYTGLALGFSAPTEPPQYWLRGARYPNYLGVPGATYTRTGSRAGLDAAVIYAANVPRVAAVNGLRVFKAGTNEARNSTATGGTVGVVGSGGVLPTGWQITRGALTLEIVSIVGDAVRLRFSGTPSGGYIDVGLSSAALATASPGQIWTGSRSARLVAGTLPAAAGGAFDITVDCFDSASVYVGESGSTIAFSGSTFVRGVHTSPALIAGTAFVETKFRVLTNNGVPCDFTVEIASPQLEQSSFATDYIPNPNTGASSSAGTDDVQVAASVLPATSGTLVFLADLPNQAYQAGISQRVLNGNFPVIINDQTFVSAINGAGGSAAVAGLPTSGARRIAVLYTPGAATRMSVNGSAVAVGTDVGAVYSTAAIQIGNRSALDRPLNGGLGVFAVYRATPSDAQLQAMSAL